jgi:formate-dependent nitrite reductase membrane component NrfD
MSPFVANPEWGIWILLYFYLGGIAAGAYFLAALVQLLGRDEDYPIVRIAHWIAFPLINVCGLLLTIDLTRPERFYHMLLQAEDTEGLPRIYGLAFKPWSPMSVGAWALLIFGVFSFVSFLGSLWPHGRLARLVGRNWFGHVFQVVGAFFGFFVASYTGVLLAASNEPVWSQSDWIGALFLTSAASTGVATVYLIGRLTGALAGEPRERLVRADLGALLLEMAVFLVFLASLQSALSAGWEVWGLSLALLLAALTVGLLLPLAIYLFFPGGWRSLAVAVLVLVGGLLTRYAVLHSPTIVLGQPELLAASAEVWTVFQIGFFVLVLALLTLTAVMVALRPPPAVNRAALVGGFALVTGALICWSALTPPDQPGAPRSLLSWSISPEIGRPRGGGPGASLFRDPSQIQPRTKIPVEE